VAKEDKEIGKDAAANLQKAAQALASVSEKMEKVFAKGADFAKSMTNEFKNTAKESSTLEEILTNTADLGKDILREKKAQTAEMKTQSMAMNSQQSIMVMTLRQEQMRVVAQAKALGATKEQLDTIKGQYMTMIDQTREMEAQAAKQEAAEELAAENEKHAEALRDKLKEITGYQGVFKDIFTDGRVAAGIFLNQVQKGMKNMTALFDHARHEGMAVSQAFHETGLAISDSFSLTGTSAKDSMEVMAGMRAEMGTLEGHTRDARLEAASLARSFGISNEEAGKLTAQLSMMPGATMETANETARFAANMAKAAHVAPGEVLKDMSKNQEAIAKYGKDGGKNMASMAVAAKKIGMEMGPLVQMTENLLDFENSIEKQMEASVLLGREINLDKARQLALEGDLAGATKAMLDQVGGEVEFNKMNAIQRQALADSYGVSVGEMQKMVKNQDKLNDLTEDQQAALAAGDVTMDELAAGAGGLFDKLKETGITAFSLVEGFSTLSGTMEGVKDSMKMFGIESLKQVKAIAKKILLQIKSGAIAAKDFVVAKAKAAWDLMTGKSKMAMDLKGHLLRMAQKAKEFLFDKSKRKEMLASAKKALTGGLKGALKGGEPKSDVPGLDKTKDLGPKAAEGSSKSGGGLKSLAAGLKAMGNSKVFKGIGAVALAGPAFILAIAAIPFLSFIALTGPAIRIGLSGLGKGLAAVGASAAGAIQGIAVLALFGVALIPLTFALSLLTPLVEAFGNIIIGVLGAVPPIIQAIADGFVTMLSAITPEAILGLMLLGPAFGLAAIGMLAFAASLGILAIAAIFGAPALVALGLGMMALGVGVMLAAVGLELIAGIMPTIDQAFVGVATSITSIVALLPAMLMMGTALFGMAAGLAAFAVAGVFTLPTIMGLIALSLVAPILIALGNSINFDLGGGSSVDSSAEDSKMDTLIEEIRSLKAAFQTPGVINMDGQKVGDVIGLAVSTSGIA